MPWDVDARELYSRPARRGALYFGRAPDRRLEGTRQMGLAVGWQRPIEDAVDGCPGGWYRTSYANSVARYTRRRDSNGGRVANPFFDRAPWQVQAAVMYLEGEQERWNSYRDEVNAARWKAGPGKPRKR